jgi:glycosyltransferase involved in cell wall biosynthesis
MPQVNRRPHVLAFTTSYFPHIGGVEVTLRQVAERLAADFDLTIVTARRTRKSPAAESQPEANLRRLGLGGPLDKWLLPVLATFLRRELTAERAAGRELILWGLDITQGSLAAAWLRRWAPSVPFILTIQYGETARRVERGRLGLIRLGFRSMLAQADRVTAISTALVQLARENGHQGRVWLIPNGVDLNRFRRPGAKPPDGIPTVITVSRLVGKNGVDTLLRSVAALSCRNVSLQCRVLGDGPERSHLEQLATDLGIGPRVQFLGSLPPAEVPRHLWHSDVFVRASRSEGLGNAFIEAMAAGVPVVGTPVGGVMDLVHDGETGMLAPVDDPEALADRIQRLLEDPPLAQRLARRALALVKERHDIDVIAGQYAQLFKEALQG